MKKFIGEKLEVVLSYLEEKGINYSVEENNHNINGDTKLVTNIIAKDKTVVLTVGSFIFDVRNKKNEE